MGGTYSARVYRPVMSVSFARHVAAHPDGHKYGVSIQISINLGKIYLRTAHILHKTYCGDLNLGESLCISTFLLFPDSGLNLLQGFYFFIFFILTYF